MNSGSFCRTIIGSTGRLLNGQFLYVYEVYFKNESEDFVEVLGGLPLPTRESGLPTRYLGKLIWGE